MKLIDWKCLWCSVKLSAVILLGLCLASLLIRHIVSSPVDKPIDEWTSAQYEYARIGGSNIGK